MIRKCPDTKKALLVGAESVSKIIAPSVNRQISIGIIFVGVVRVKIVVTVADVVVVRSLVLQTLESLWGKH